MWDSSMREAFLEYVAVLKTAALEWYARERLVYFLGGRQRHPEYPSILE